MKAKKGWGMAAVTELLPSKHEALSSKSSTAKKRKRKEKKRKDCFLGAPAVVAGNTNVISIVAPALPLVQVPDPKKRSLPGLSLHKNK
jgi:hypothetical protein